MNPNVKIIMTVINGGRKGLALFSPQPGNYKVIAAEELNLKMNDIVEFRCPVCGAEFVSDVSENLAEIGFRLDNGTQGHVKFSRRYGEEATYFVTDEEVRSYGANADMYGSLNFFGAGPSED